MSKQHWYTDAKFVAEAVYKATGVRMDAGETALVIRQLTYLAKRTYDKKYPELKARQFLPVNYEVPEGAKFWSERGFDWAGMATVGGDLSTDIPSVSIVAQEVVRAMKYIRSSYKYTVEDIAASAFTGVSLDTKEAFASKRSQENSVEQIAAIGNASENLPGFLTNSNVTLLTAAGGDITGGWTTATPAQILNDLNTIANKVVTQSLNVFAADTMILPIDRYSLVMTTPYSDVVPTVIGRVFLEQSPYVKNLDQWAFLDTANAAGSGPRVVAYKRDAEVVEMMISKEYTQVPPETRALAFIVNAYMKFGGVAFHYPLGAVYADGV